LVDPSQNAPYLKWDPLLDLGGKRGGALCVAAWTGLIVSTSLHGEIPEEKVPKYRDLACEKAQRLAMYPGHLSSWESRDGSSKWGGAIRANDYILSFSGLPELWDEAFMLLLANHSSEIDRVASDRIAEVSWNLHWTQIRESYEY
jgi:hypothetical protein